MTADPLIRLAQVTHRYARPGQATVQALTDVTLTIAPGTFTAVLGKSGSGKSTLLNLIAGLDRPTHGTIQVAGTALQTLNEDALARWRGRTVGVVFQFFQLLPTLTTLENLLMAMEISARIPSSQRLARAQELLQRMGIAEQAQQLPATLSGGQQQRAAIARALVNTPLVLVADEPTGNLDSHTAQEVLTLFRTLVTTGTTLLVVTHDRDLAAAADQVIELVDGQISERGPAQREMDRVVDAGGST